MSDTDDQFDRRAARNGNLAIFSHYVVVDRTCKDPPIHALGTNPFVGSYRQYCTRLDSRHARSGRPCEFRAAATVYPHAFSLASPSLPFDAADIPQLPRHLQLPPRHIGSAKCALSID